MYWVWMAPLKLMVTSFIQRLKKDLPVKQGYLGTELWMKFASIDYWQDMAEIPFVLLFGIGLETRDIKIDLHWWLVYNIWYAWFEIKQLWELSLIYFLQIKHQTKSGGWMWCRDESTHLPPIICVLGSIHELDGICRLSLWFFYLFEDLIPWVPSVFLFWFLKKQATKKQNKNHNSNKQKQLLAW